METNQQQVVAQRELPEFLKVLAADDVRVELILKDFDGCEEFNELITVFEDVYSDGNKEHLENYIVNIFNVNVRQMGTAKIKFDFPLFKKLMKNNEYAGIYLTLAKDDDIEAQNFLYTAQDIYKNDRKNFKEFLQDMLHAMFDENLNYTGIIPVIPMWNMEVDFGAMN